MTESNHTTAAIIIIGAEVLSGKVNDENGPFLLRALRERGIDVKEIRTIDDDRTTIAKAVRELSQLFTYVFTTGGIGPTHDDITLESIAEAFNCSVVRHQELADHFVQRFSDLKRQAAALRMANLPEGATVKMAGYVPVIQKENVTVFPGVPSLMRSCFDVIAPQLRGAEFFSDAIYLNASESLIASQLTEVQNACPNVAIGSYPQFGDAPYRVKITVDSRHSEAVNHAIQAILASLDPAWVIDLES